MEATPHLFYKSLDGNENRRSSFKINGVVICVASKAHAKISGNHCTISHASGVVFRNVSGVAFDCASVLQFRTSIRGVRRDVASQQSLMLSNGF